MNKTPQIIKLNVSPLLTNSTVYTEQQLLPSILTSLLYNKPDYSGGNPFAKMAASIVKTTAQETATNILSDTMSSIGNKGIKGIKNIKGIKKTSSRSSKKSSSRSPIKKSRSQSPNKRSNSPDTHVKQPIEKKPIEKKPIEKKPIEKKPIQMKQDVDISNSTTSLPDSIEYPKIKTPSRSSKKSSSRSPIKKSRSQSPNKRSNSPDTRVKQPIEKKPIQMKQDVDISNSATSLPDSIEYPKIKNPSRRNHTLSSKKSNKDSPSRSNINSANKQPSHDQTRQDTGPAQRPSSRQYSSPTKQKQQSDENVPDNSDITSTNRRSRRSRRDQNKQDYTQTQVPSKQNKESTRDKSNRTSNIKHSYNQDDELDQNYAGQDYEPAQNQQDGEPDQNDAGQDYEPDQNDAGQDYEPYQNDAGQDYEPDQNDAGQDYKPDQNVEEIKKIKKRIQQNKRELKLLNRALAQKQGYL
jgi:hypothetical protein